MKRQRNKKSDVNLFLKLIEKLIVFEMEKIIVTLLDWTELEVIIE
ncbi:hypothetical protein [Clostridium sp. LS]|nr:hypothetical protein [Clostridium sp. LS]